MNNLQLAVPLFLQIALILLVCRAVGVVALWFRQPQVVAEMVAGVLIGPSFLGLVAPDWQRALFPWDPAQQSRDTQSYLYPASQLCLALYMFLVGARLYVEFARKQIRSSLAVSLAGIVAPFCLGAALAWLFHAQTGLFPKPTSRSEAMLFLGASLCITAFPMLARIIDFKGLVGTTMGTVALGAGAINDAAAWCLLALVLASFDNAPAGALVNIGGGLLFLAAAFFVVRPLLSRLERHVIRDDPLTDHGLALCLVCMSLGAWFTGLIGLHAVFGAFIMGSVLPRGHFTRDLVHRVEPLAVALLLPLFFTYSGLNTKIALLNSPWHWAICGLVLLAAMLGKGVACSLAARHRHAGTRSAGYWRTDECSRPDGIDHHQHWPAARRDQRRALRGAGHYGGGYHVDGFAAVRPAGGPACACRTPRKRNGRGPTTERNPKPRRPARDAGLVPANIGHCPGP
jgi:Kef-type K+ transport system membrane component KefB